jgi:hypothetical protein
MGEFISLNRIAVLLIEISVKSGKERVSTPSLVIHRVRFKKKPAKKYISIQGGVKLRKPSIFDGILSFTLSFFFPERP